MTARRRDPRLKQPCVYIMASRRNGTLYTGVTANLSRRAFEHREGLVKGFTSAYGCKTLVWYEYHDVMIDAIAREKQIKGGSRAKKTCSDRRFQPGMERPLRLSGIRALLLLRRRCEPQGVAKRPPVASNGPWRSNSDGKAGLLRCARNDG